MVREFEFIVYNRTANEIILDVVRKLNTDQMIKDMSWPENHGKRVDIPREEKLFPEIERLILSNRYKKQPSNGVAVNKTVKPHITHNCIVGGHSYCKGHSGRWGKCFCDCHIKEPEWGERHEKIKKRYISLKEDGKIKEFVLIPKDEEGVLTL